MAKADAPLAAPDGCTFWCDGHLCDRPVNHCDQCMCRCAHRWTRERPDIPHGLTLHLTSSRAFDDALVAAIRRQIGEGGVPT